MPITADILASHAAYSHWATRRVLTFAQTLPEEEIARHIGNSHGSILKTFQHTYYADRAWLARLEHAGVGFEDPPPGPSLADLDRDWLPLLERFADVAGKCDANGVLAYKNLKGHAFERPIWQVVMHIVNHGTYHRGQIASMMRQLGHQPPPTDLIYYYLDQK
ncbi:MAG TPA: DinB family protein [Bryobacteraceae bacterium]|jgi:uncharacterized damage-inducible protein DinB